MSRIVFARNLRKVIGKKGASSAALYSRPQFWISLAPLPLLCFALMAATATPRGIDRSLPETSARPVAPAMTAPSLSVAPPMPVAAKPVPEGVPTIPKLSPPASVQAKADASPETLSPQGQRAARYIAKNYLIAKEASQLIVVEAFRAGKAHRVDPLLLLAIIGIESRYNPLSESPAGALGLTQAIPKYHPEKIAAISRHQGHVLNIGDNIELGAKVFSEYLRKFDNNSVLALQQYNGSLNDSSRFYSSKVLALRAKMQ